MLKLLSGLFVHHVFGVSHSENPVISCSKCDVLFVWSKRLYLLCCTLHYVLFMFCFFQEERERSWRWVLSTIHVQGSHLAWDKDKHQAVTLQDFQEVKRTQVFGHSDLHKLVLLNKLDLHSNTSVMLINAYQIIINVYLYTLLLKCLGLERLCFSF